MLDIARAARFTFEVQDLVQTLRVVGFTGKEALSEAFSFDVTLECSDGALAFADVVGRRATLRIEDGSLGGVRAIQGIVSRFEAGEEGRLGATYHATLVPSVHCLKLRHDCRVFHELAAPAILKEVLAAAGVPTDAYRLLLHGDYRVREHCVQYRESDFAFICRLMESEGIFFFFEHHEDRDVLVIGDTPYVYASVGEPETIPFQKQSGALGSGEHVSTFRYGEEVRAGRVTLRGYSYKNPKLMLESGAQTENADALEVYDYPPEYEAPQYGEKLARLRLEEEQTVRRSAVGEGTSTRFFPGACFDLDEHPRAPFNARYLLTSVEHRGLPAVGHEEAGVVYQNRFRVIPADVPFRPLQRTPRPTIKGVQTAVVVGPKGEEIHTDELGRVRVRFHWDRLGNGDRDSCWIRVSQIWAGSGFGGLHVPRVGHEVIVDFLDGDPDHPIVVGSVYHAQNLPAYALPAGKGTSGIKSSTTPGGGGSNELRFTDDKGAEEVYVHAQQDMVVDVEQDESTSVGKDAELSVGGDRSKSISGQESSSIGANQSIQVGANQTRSVGLNEVVMVGADATRAVGGSASEVIGGARTAEVTSNDTLIVGGNLSVSVGAAKSEKVDGDSSESIVGKKTVDIDGAHETRVGGSMTKIVEGDDIERVAQKKIVEVGTELELSCATGRIIIDKTGKITIEARDVEIRSAGAVRVTGDKLSVRSTGVVAVRAGAVKIRGNGVDIN